MKKFLSRVLAVTVTTGVLVAGAAAAAEAHHTTVSGSGVCTTDGKGINVTWNVVNSERDKSLTFTSNRGFSGSIDKGATKTLTETVAYPTSGLNLTVWSKWTNGVTATNQGVINLSHLRCVTPPTGVTPVAPTLTPPNCVTGSTIVLPTTLGVKYELSGNTVIATPLAGFKFTGDQRVVFGPYTLQGPLDCRTVVNTVDPKVIGPDCAHGTRIRVTDVPGVHYTVTRTGNVVNVTASITDSANYKFAPGAVTSFGPFQLQAHHDCRVQVTPVKPKVVGPSCSYPTRVKVVKVPGVRYTSFVVKGVQTVTAAPYKGYKFANDTKTVVWKFKLLKAKDCSKPKPPKLPYTA